MADDGFTKLLAAGLSSRSASRPSSSSVASTKLLPLTGITLPFVSYGGSSSSPTSGCWRCSCACRSASTARGQAGERAHLPPLPRPRAGLRGPDRHHDLLAGVGGAVARGAPGTTRGSCTGSSRSSAARSSPGRLATNTPRRANGRLALARVAAEVDRPAVGAPRRVRRQRDAVGGDDLAALDRELPVHEPRVVLARLERRRRHLPVGRDADQGARSAARGRGRDG